MVGEIATERLVVVLNKVDMLPAEQRDKLVIKAQKMLRKTFVHTKFRDPHMVAVSAKPGRHTMLDLALHCAVMLHEPHFTAGFCRWWRGPFPRGNWYGGSHRDDPGSCA